VSEPLPEMVERRIAITALDLYALVLAMSQWKLRDDGMVYSDEPLEDYLREARHLVAYITGEF
jgi:hypothetical protein